MTKSKFFILILATGLLSSCDRKASEVAQVKIKLPEKRVSKGVVALSGGTTSWGLANPSTIAEIDCYAVITAAADFPAGQCEDLAGTPVASASYLTGLYAPGAEILLTLDPGKQRTISVLGFKSSAASCMGMFDAGFASTQFSSPLLVGKTTVDLVAGDNDVTIGASLTGASQIEKCSGGAFTAWPRCKPTIASATYLGQGQISLTGTCLDQASTLQIENATDGVISSLSIASKAATNLVGTATTNLILSKAKVYRLLVTTASAQTASVGLNLASKFVVKSDGVVIGNLISGQIGCDVHGEIRYLS